MSGYYRRVCHVNMHCSGTNFSHFCIKHLAQKKQIIPKFPQKQTKSPPLETSKPENMLKNDAREELKNRNVQKK